MLSARDLLTLRTGTPMRITLAIAIVAVAGGSRLAIPAAAGEVEPAAADVVVAAPAAVAPAAPAPATTAPSAKPTPSRTATASAKPTPRSTSTAASRSRTRTPAVTPSTRRATPKPTATPTRRSTSRSSAAVSSGDPRSIARSMLAARGQSGQFSCLDSLWTKESGWRTTAANPSGAYGIPQALPGSKMASAGSDWRTNPATQIEWGLGYIADRWGSPCAAWSHSQSAGWY